MWHPVVGYEGLYEVSPDGQVRNARNGRVLKPVAFPNRYLRVSLGGGPGKCGLIHRLVAAAFIPGDSTLQVNHKNGVRDDNRVENLEWVSCSDNHKHSYAKLPRKKHALTKHVVLTKGEVIMHFDSVVLAAKELGVVPGSVASAENKGHLCRGFVVAYV